MKKAYLLAYSNELGTREQVRDALDANPLIENWRYDLPNSFYLISETSSKELANSIRSSLPQGRFIVSLVDKDYWGWNNDETWYLLKNKTQKPTTGT